jgi:hypothetical protein
MEPVGENIPTKPRTRSMQTFIKNNLWSILALLVACGFTYGAATRDISIMQMAMAKNEQSIDTAVRESRTRDEKIQDQYVVLLSRYESSVGKMTAEIEGLKEQVALLARARNSMPKGGQ